ncbi:hypothetical protein [Lactobacillus sp. Sy-1]|nr:hypothetical protein [Lactobacillus sp. Sy-1]MBW1605885.1 hypothetical protein [Lactobacillus sp. Sy-1]
MKENHHSESFWKQLSKLLSSMVVTASVATVGEFASQSFHQANANNGGD